MEGNWKISLLTHVSVRNFLVVQCHVYIQTRTVTFGLLVLATFIMSASLSNPILSKRIVVNTFISIKV